MERFREVVENIDRLESMIPINYRFNKPDWKSVWNQIRTTGRSFKGSRFPSKEEHERQWDRFQALVDEVKATQAELQREWEKKREESERLRDIIVDQARIARPSDDTVITLLTGGMNLVVEAFLGPFDKEKEMLQSCGESLKEGWTLLRKNKSDMLGRDKNTAFNALNETKELLDRKWEDYRHRRQEARDQYQRAKEKKRHNWEKKIESNIQSLEERREKLSSALSRREEHLENLHEQLENARSDSFRARVSGWISDEKSNINDIERKLNDLEKWIIEENDKLNS